MKPTLLIRADASHEIGVGHVMRCLALAQAWQDAGGRVVVGWAEMPGAVLDRLHREKFAPRQIGSPVGSLADAESTATMAQSEAAEWIVVDGARFDGAYFEVLRTAGVRVLAVDDSARLDAYPVDLLLNQNLAAAPARYAAKTDASVSLLLGPRYALLRREFRMFQAWQRPPHRTPLHLLVSFGGGDVDNFTALVLKSLAQGECRDLCVVVLAGATNRHGPALRKLVGEAAFPCEMRVGVDNVAEVMAWADVAITSAGSTVWELAGMQLPALVLDIDDGQLANLGDLNSIPLFRVRRASELGSGDLAAELQTLRAEARPANGLDVNGAPRVVEAMRSVSRATPAISPSLVFTGP